MLSRRLLYVCAGYGVFLFVLVMASVNGLVSPRMVGVIGLLGMLGFGVIFYAVIKKDAPFVTSLDGPLDASTHRKRISYIRKLKLYLVVLVMSLLYGLFHFEKTYLFPELVGIIVNLCVTAGLIYVIVRLQRSLR